MKKIINSLIIFILFALNSGAIFEIDAARNAMRHNNLGVNHMRENYYYGAIKEFEIAIQINPNSQASAIYYNNLGKAYMRIDYPDLAEKSFKEALRRNNGNLEYYQNIVNSPLDPAYLKAIEEDKKLRENLISLQIKIIFDCSIICSA